MTEDPFNIQFPNLSNDSNGGILLNENDSDNLVSQMLNSNVYLQEQIGI